VGERVSGRSSIAFGFQFSSGSRDESPGLEGAAHFLEHMVFKGTARRGAREIAASLERVGGSLDAFTGKETTCFYARCLAEDLELAADVLTDLVSGPRLDADDVERERSVVVEEQRGVLDAPEDLVGDLAMESLWPGHPMGNPILGTEASLARVNAVALGGFHRVAYAARRLVVSVTGSVDPDRVEAVLTPRLTLPGGGNRDRKPPAERDSELLLLRRDAAQTHLVLHTGAPAYGDPARLAVQLLAEILGGGMSSRLFQSIREDLGLAYSVAAFSDHFEDCGQFGIALAVNPERAAEALARTHTEIERLLRDGLEPGELAAGVAQIRGSLIMGEESLTNRMFRLAMAEARGRGMETVADRVAAYEAVTEADVLEAARRLFAPGRGSLTAVGPSEPGDLDGARYATRRVLEDLA